MFETCWYLWPFACFCTHLMFNISFCCCRQNVSNIFVQLTEGRSARDQPKQPPAKKKGFLERFALTHSKVFFFASPLQSFGSAGEQLLGCLMLPCISETTEEERWHIEHGIIDLLLFRTLWLKLYRLKSVGANTYFSVELYR